ncbi:MAG: DUF342 domain-containing protein [Desulfobacterales bacterium]|nr:DUF342 domain-containing protein [Desulfobacterales bacterium]
MSQDKFETICPACKNIIKADLTLFIGKKIECNKCGNKFELVKQNGKLPLIVRLALSQNFITDKEVNEALSIRENDILSGINTSIEEICVKKNFISAKQMAFLHSLVELFNTRKKDHKFLKIALENSYTIQKEIDNAFKLQIEEFKKIKRIRAIKAILLEAGALTEKEAEEADGFAQRAFDVEALFDISFSENNLEAYISSLYGIPNTITVEDIKKFLSENNVKYGIVDDSKISEFIKNSDINKPFCIAAGKPFKPWIEPQIKYYFDIEYMSIGTIKPDGSIDFKEKGTVPSVKSEDILAEKIPMMPGIPGIDVFGNPIEPPKPKDIKLRKGQGTYLSDDESKIYARISGQPKVFFGGKFSVLTEHLIEGDIDLKTGHVEFNGNVNIKGSVQNGFRVKGVNISAEDIYAATIEANGDVIVSGGIVGANITARGLVVAKFIRESNISTYGDVIISKEIIDSDILISGACTIKQGKIINSNIVARQGIEACDIGTAVSNSSKIKVGDDEHIEKELNRVKNDISNKKEALLELGRLQEEKEKIKIESAELELVKARVLDARKVFLDKIEEFKKQIQKKQVEKTQELLNELIKRSATVNEALINLNDRHYEIDKKIEEFKNKQKIIEDAIEELYDEKKDIVLWSKKNKSRSFVKVLGTIYEGTKISGEYSSVTIQHQFKNVDIKEVKVNDPTSKIDYRMDVIKKR